MVVKKNNDELQAKISDIFVSIFVGQHVIPFTANKKSLYNHYFEVTNSTAVLNVSITTSKDIKDACSKLTYKVKEFKDNILALTHSSLTSAGNSYLQERLILGFSKAKNTFMRYDEATNRHTITISYRWSW